MNSLVKVVPNVKKYKTYLEDVKNKINPMMISGLTDSGKVHLAYSTYFYAERPICIVTYNELQAKKIIKDLAYFEDSIEYFPKKEILAYDYLTESKDSLFERIEVLNNIINKKARIIVTTVEAVMQPMIAKETLYKNLLKLKVGQELNLDKLKETLINLGYERYDVIEGKGQFSIRGGIVDIAVNSKSGVRIELWGDEIDSIRKFNILTQRSTDMLEETSIYPAFEYVLENSIDQVCKKIEESKYAGVLNDIAEEDIEQIKSGDYISKIDKYFTFFYNKQESILDYLDKDCIVFLDEISKIKARSENIIKDNETILKGLVEKRKIPIQILEQTMDYIKIIDKTKEKQTIYLENKEIGFTDVQSMHAKRNGYSFSYREVNFFRSSMDLLFEELQKANKKSKQTVVLCGNYDNAKKLSKLLEEKNIKYTLDENLTTEIVPGVTVLTSGTISTGFESYDLNLLVISASELFVSREKKRTRLSQSFKEGETVIFSDLKIGDYVVHKTHGIGEYVGVNTIKADGVTKDYIKVKYKDNDILYVPISSLDNIRKYIGAEKGAPKINRLGSKDWEKTKARVKNNLREVARELIELYAKRQHSKGYSFSKDTIWQKEFEDSFPYVETDDQLRCIEEVKKDMEAEKPMDRLLCGDVGYGKTEVAIRAAFKACMDQKQVAYLVPTTVLAQQQYESFKERMEKFPIRVDVLNRFRTPKEQKQILEKLEKGELDVVIGTHRILSKDVKFKNLGFLIIDEEHRFGVKDKEKIKGIKTNVDVLTMTATPIPRTLHMSILGIRDMSVIYEPPYNRKPVQTYVLEYDEEIIKEAITKELERGGQVFYLFNNVQNIQQKASQISNLVPEANVVYAHGQMPGKQIEDIMQEFVEQKTNVLVCTTILESGIDIPNANTIIVENADRMGLAQLYQIRGRVGRSDRQAYAYITYKRDKLLSEVADKRLKAIKEFTEFGSGFKIAMRDLEIRGAGSLLGEIQSGHLEQVGYDTYCKLLDEVVKEMKGIKVTEEADVQVDLNVTCYIPDNYIEDSGQKIEVYQKIALCRTEEDIQNVIDEVIDRYGNMPKELENLLEVARIKQLAKEQNIVKVESKQNGVVFTFASSENIKYDIAELVRKYGNKIKFSAGIKPMITYKTDNVKEQELLKQVKEFLEIN